MTGPVKTVQAPGKPFKWGDHSPIRAVDKANAGQAIKQITPASPVSRKRFG